MFTENWKQTHKVSYCIQAEIAKPGVKVYNELEDCHYTTTDEKCVVLTGLVGEQWVTSKQKLVSTYTNEDGTEINLDEVTEATGTFRVKTKEGTTNWATHVPASEVVEVQTSWGDILVANRPEIQHDEGDYLVCGDKDGKPDTADKWVVNGRIFKLTYDMTNFE